METGVTEKEGQERERERDCVCVCFDVLSGGEMDGGRRATMWVSSQHRG